MAEIVDLADVRCGTMKRAAYDQPRILDGVKAVVVDFEGTATPHSFVKDILISHANTCIRTYIEDNFKNEELKKDIEAIKLELQLPSSDDGTEAVVQHIQSQLDSGKYSNAVQHILTCVWRDGYKAGALQGELFGDVVPVLKQIIHTGIKVYSYSTELTVEMQKLFFSYSCNGNVLGLFSGHFDRASGTQSDSDSYAKIALDLQLKTSEILYLTDLPAEADAASKAGARVCVVVREGNPPLSDDDLQFVVLFSLHDILESGEDVIPAKRLHDNYQYDEYDDCGSDENDDEEDDDDDEEEDEEDQHRNREQGKYEVEKRGYPVNDSNDAENDESQEGA